MERLKMSHFYYINENVRLKWPIWAASGPLLVTHLNGVKMEVKNQIKGLKHRYMVKKQ